MKIAYGYIYGRKERLLNKDYPEEMFYGYHYFLNKYGKVEILEYEKSSSKIFTLFEKVLIKITKLPIFFSQMTSVKNLKVIMSIDYLILSNDRLLFSLLPLLVCRKFKRKKLSVTVFAMNMIQEVDLSKINIIKKFIMKQSYKLVNNFIFLGEGESNLAIKFFGSEEKINHIPFYVDNYFWFNERKLERDGILFVGNDSNREFDKVAKLANYFKEIKFTIISKHLEEEDFKYNNVKFIKGSWGNQKISDSELKSIYSKSKLVIIPLIESFQPSGQSVTLQAMALKTPVLISRTSGFWDKSNFHDMINIFFASDNSLNGWIQKINDLYNNPAVLKKVGEEGYKLIQKEYSKEVFEKKLSNIVGI